MLPQSQQQKLLFSFLCSRKHTAFLSLSFLMGFPVKVTILEGRGNFRVTNPKDLKAFRRQACVRLPPLSQLGTDRLTDDACLA